MQYIYENCKQSSCIRQYTREYLKQGSFIMQCINRSKVFFMKKYSFIQFGAFLLHFKIIVFPL